MYMSTSEIAKHIGRSINYLKQRKGTVFLLGIHYFEPNGSHDPYWKIEAMIDWIENKNCPSNNKMLDEILESLVG